MQVGNERSGATNLSSYGLVLRKIKLPRLAFICRLVQCRPTCFVNCSRRITAALPFKLDSSNLFSLLIADFKLFLFHLAAQGPSASGVARGGQVGQVPPGAKGWGRQNED